MNLHSSNKELVHAGSDWAWFAEGTLSERWPAPPPPRLFPANDHCPSLALPQPPPPTANTQLPDGVLRGPPPPPPGSRRVRDRCSALVGPKAPPPALAREVIDSVVQEPPPPPPPTWLPEATRAGGPGVPVTSYEKSADSVAAHPSSALPVPLVASASVPAPCVERKGTLFF